MWEFLFEMERKLTRPCVASQSENSHGRIHPVAYFSMYARSDASAVADAAHGVDTTVTITMMVVPHVT
jgi:hypothetical protein